MVDKLRKIVQWIWLSKERMVLVVMMGILCWRVYVVVYPSDSNGVKTVSVVPPSADVTEKTARPDEPPVPPPLPAPEDWSSLWKRNPFTVYSSTAQQSGPGDDDSMTRIRLLDIQVLPSGVAQAQIYTNTAKWYKEGTQFESYKLNSIDVEQKTCEIYSEKQGKYITLRLSK